VDFDQVVLTIQHFTRRWPDVKRYPGESERAERDTDGGFERLLRASLEAIGAPGDVSLARELHLYDDREGAIVPQHEHDLVMRLTDGPCVVEAKAWTSVVDKGPVVEFLGKVLDFIAAPKFDSVADSLKVGFNALLKEMKRADAEGRDSVDVLFDDKVLAGAGLVVDDVLSAVIEHLTDAEVKTAVAEALAAADLTGHLRSFRKDGEVRPYYVQRETKGLTHAKDILFNDVVRFLKEAGFAGAYLFIDDIENLTDQMANKETIEFAKEVALCLVRPGRASGDTRFFTGVLTTHQQAATKLARGWGEAGLQAVARLDQMADTSVKVPLPSEDGALEMLAEYIKEHRLPGQEGLQWLHPFTEAAARKLVSGVKPALHPRTFLQKAHFAVRQAADDGLKSIEVANIEKLFSNIGVDATASTGEPETFDTY
jgi:hypothetical protein